MMNVNIRPATAQDAPGMARVHVDSWRTTYAGIVNDEFLARLSYAHSEERFRRSLAVNSPEPGQRAFVAVHLGRSESSDSGNQAGQFIQLGQIVGFAVGGPTRSQLLGFRGELYAIYILREFQRRGIGRSLVQAVIESLVQEGMTSMHVWVLAANPACKFYEALGGRRLRSQQIQIGTQSLEEVAYGWEDLRDLCLRPPADQLRPSVREPVS